MQPGTPRQPAREQGLPPSDNDAELSDELAAVVGGARRRALRDGDRQIDTAHLLHSLLEYDFDVRAVFGDGPHMARLLGYLVQRSIGYGLRWQSGVEDSGAVPGGADAEGLSPLAAGAMDYARDRAVQRGAPRARGVDLLAAIVVDPQSRAVEVLARAGIDPVQVFARIDKYAEGPVEGAQNVGGPAADPAKGGDTAAR
ncbi:Clp protease N-terminal domain-containing protein [Streptomyces sp. DH24]|uniref:Clp protease N-terminal domain-containing protein n=1 Tax=Streptomyces sp. DH24 TaxID=3040123 RepID=UPI002441708B|nr:Clp protease N-terminal domain-containing protein [Streptomyces sp. DH24]MDG9715771.1 Clp protease N-terminal domain-containing protein [Streptomyces sp. DH24]